MLIEILPDGLEDELENPLNAHVRTHHQIIEWCKARTIKSRQKALAAQKLKQAVPGRMLPLIAHETSNDGSSEVPPAWARPLINMVGSFNGKGDQALRGRTQNPKGDRAASPSPSQRARTPSPSGFKPKGKFVYRGCNHCGKKGHERKDCREFIALEAKHGGKLPDSYKGAREIAYEKWRNNQKARMESQQRSGQVKALTTGDETCDEDSDFSESELKINASPIIAALNIPVKPMTNALDPIPSR